MPAKGKSRFIATDEQRRQVEIYTATGNTQEQIAILLDCSVDTLDRHFRRELDTGGLKANSKVAGTLYKKAMSGDVASMIFWMKTRARWKETTTHELTGAEGKPIATESVFMLDALPLDDLRQLEAILGKLGSEAPAPSVD